MTDPDPGMTGPDPGAPDPTAPKPVPTPDVNCTSDHAKGGMACSVPCVTTCGFYDLGTKGCDCVNGVFVSCHCPRPWDYQGAPTAPTCDTTDGRTHWIDNTPCTQEWAQCIGTADVFDPCTDLQALVARELDRSALVQRHRVRTDTLIAAMPVLPGVREYVAEAQRLGMTLGVASSSSMTTRPIAGSWTAS